MTEEELQEIRTLLYDDEGVGNLEERLASDWAAVRYNAQVNQAARTLLAEVERQRVENAAMRELIRRVVDVNGMSEWNLAGLADAARAILTDK